MEHFRSMDYLCGNVEGKFGKFSIDLFGLFDFLALKPNETIGVQACAVHGGEIGLHLTKMMESDKFQLVVKAGWRIMLIAFWPWAKKKVRKEYHLLEYNPLSGKFERNYTQ
jgi:hypothetical protein